MDAKFAKYICKSLANINEFIVNKILKVNCSLIAVQAFLTILVLNLLPDIQKNCLGGMYML